MYKYEPDYNADESINTSGKDYLYGDELRDRLLLQNPTFLPRFAHLSRKVFLHYARDHYNPHTILMADELLLRTHIKDFIEYRIQHRTPGYDWEWLDHFFRKFVGDIFGIELTPDIKRIEDGFKPPFKGFIHPGNTLPN